MARKLSSVINCVDIETTCWEPRNTQPPDEIQDIIEIGIVTLDTREANWNIKDKLSILVKPKSSRVSDFCTKLTSITSEMLEKGGVSLHAAIDILRKDYKSKNRTWISWGDFDRKVFESQCKLYNIPYPFGPRHINLKNAYSVLSGLGVELGMDAALDRIGEALEGTHHRGADDAYNIAKVLKHMMFVFQRGEHKWLNHQQW